MIQLTKDQEQKYPTIEWLLDPFSNYGSGRTQLMAIAFINLAINYPNREIHIFDHSDLHNHYTFILSRVKQLISEREDKDKFYIKHSDNSIFYHP